MTTAPAISHAASPGQSATWPSTDAERRAFADWQNEVANGDTHIGFRHWLDVMAADDPDTYAAYGLTATQAPEPPAAPTPTGGPVHWDPECPMRRDGDSVSPDTLDGFAEVDCDHCLPVWEVEFNITVRVAAPDEDAAYDNAHPIAIKRATAGDLNTFDDCVTRLDPGTYTASDLDNPTN